MHGINRFALLICAGLVVLAAGMLRAEESKIAVTDLPEAVATAFHAAYPAAVINGASILVDKGETYYVLASLDGKIKRTVLYTDHSKFFESTESIAAALLPDAVKKKTALSYPKGVIAACDKIVRDSGTFFNLQLQSEKKLYEVSINEQGTLLYTKFLREVK
jgi:hypothetical protein